MLHNSHILFHFFLILEVSILKFAICNVTKFTEYYTCNVVSKDLNLLTKWRNKKQNNVVSFEVDVLPNIYIKSGFSLRH